MLERVPDLPWPANLFSLPYLAANSTAPLFAGASKKSLGDDKCRCGQPHHHAVSRVVTNDTPFGYNRSVVWYCSMNCRNRDMGL